MKTRKFEEHNTDFSYTAWFGKSTIPYMQRLLILSYILCFTISQSVIRGDNSQGTLNIYFKKVTGLQRNVHEAPNKYLKFERIFPMHIF